MKRIKEFASLVDIRFRNDESPNYYPSYSAGDAILALRNELLLKWLGKEVKPYVKLDDIVTSRGISIPTIVPSKYFEDKRSGYVENDTALRTEVLGGVGPFDTYRVYCISDDNIFNVEEFEIGLKSIKEKNQTLYVMVEDKLIENSIEKILMEDKRDFVMVLKNLK